MRRPSGVIFLFLVTALMAGNAGGGPRGSGSEVRTIALTRVIRIPVSALSVQESAELQDGDSANLAAWPGAADEPPEGPNGFDVLDDGSFLISDPLRSRIAVFDSQGKFRGAWKIAFAADSITVIPKGLVLVHEASTGQLHVFDSQGQPHPNEGAALPEPAPARVLDSKSGTVSRLATGDAHGGPLDVRFDIPGLTLLSLQTLATDHEGNTYIALETTAGGEATDAINLKKYVRRYAASGKLVCEITDIPLDYYIAPVDELRVHKGIVYQLMTTSSEVRINVWDTN
jgi:hypothetical protein